MIYSLIEYLEQIKSVCGKFDTKKHLFYRGHSKTEYVLQPSVFRDINYKEKDIVLDFKHYSPVHDINYDFTREVDKVLADMQHYGIPTRLLDWTLAPLNALYFACIENEGQDGEVIILNPWKYWEKIVRDKDQEEIHQIHILSRALLAYDWKFDAIKNYISKNFNYDNLRPEDIEMPFAYISSYTNKRILHQRGCFTIHGICKSELEKISEADDCIERIEVDGKSKTEIIYELNLLYVNQYSIYPDFEGMSEMIEAKGSLFNLKDKKYL